jgi:hypothetical protein
MNHPRRAFCTAAAALAVGFSTAASIDAQRGNDDKKPSLAFRVTPPFGFAPLKVRVTVDVRGGADDYPDFYCPAIEWDWADGTESETTEDCAPYEAGKSTINRRYTSEHTYQQSGNYQIYFRMRQKDKIVGAGNGTVQVRPGAREDLDR